MKLKFRIYAGFQFLSSFWILLIVISATLFVYNASNIYNKPIDAAFWRQQLGYIFSFEYNETISTLASVLVYFSILLYIISIIMSLFIFRSNNKNFYDALFLMFFFIPLISNFFALMAQLSFKTGVFGETRFSKKDLALIAAKLRNDIQKDYIKNSKDKPSKKTTTKKLNKKSIKVKPSKKIIAKKSNKKIVKAKTKKVTNKKTAKGKK